MLSNSQEAFFALVRAGLWEKDVRLSEFKELDFSEICRLAEEQTVVGLVAAGLEHLNDTTVPQDVLLAFVGQTIQLEQRNIAMNVFIGGLIKKMRQADIYTLLIKGQGVAQCYERPLWRVAGDIDFLLSRDNYQKAWKYLKPLASQVDKEGIYDQHLAMTIDSWDVELHGTQRTRLWNRIDTEIDEIQHDVFCGGYVRSWMDGKTQVFLPGVNEDIIFIFTHILQHFYLGGIGIRQICDLCRLIWTYKEDLNKELLNKRLNVLGIMTEWKAFAAFAVDYLGMPPETMPMYSPNAKWKRKADKICSFIMEAGNFGHNRDKSYYRTCPYFKRKMISFWRHTTDSLRYFFIFPVDSARLWTRMFVQGVNAVTKGR